MNLNVNARQNKFEVDILKNVDKIANLRPKIGQIPLLTLNINGLSLLYRISSILTVLLYYGVNCKFALSHFLTFSWLYYGVSRFVAFLD